MLLGKEGVTPNILYEIQTTYHSVNDEFIKIFLGKTQCQVTLYFQHKALPIQFGAEFMEFLIDENHPHIEIPLLMDLPLSSIKKFFPYNNV
jgi:hypothetical protein